MSNVEPKVTNANDQLTLEVDLSDPGELSDNAIDQAVNLMKSGRLHRYGEYSGTEPHAALFEKEFAEYVGSRYAVGVNSGGCALFLALKCVAVEQGDSVMVNAFNLAPVPGAIQHAGGKAVLVEIGHDHRIDLQDLRLKAEQSKSKVLLLTHMRGHIADMEQIAQICEEFGITLIEDCAHTMGAKWNGKFTGRFGAVGCFSTQTFKHINSGEGGIIITDDEDIAAKAILYSGSYMLYAQHKSRPAPEVFERWNKKIPNFSMRMSNLVAALARSQLAEMPERDNRWNQIYSWLEQRLNAIDGIEVPARESKEQFVPSSIQFHVTSLSQEQLLTLVENCTSRGVAIKWFGRNEPLGYTSQYQHWQYIQSQELPKTTEILATTCDMRIPLSLTQSHCDTIATIIENEITRLI